MLENERKTLENSMETIYTWFGTKGSQVQILSSRPHKINDSAGFGNFAIPRFFIPRAHLLTFC